jgi:cephalosporin hydroxylase
MKRKVGYLLIFATVALSAGFGVHSASADETSDVLREAVLRQQEQRISESESRDLEFAQMQNEMQKQQQMQQAMSNVLQTMHEMEMAAIRNIHGG